MGTTGTCCTSGNSPQACCAGAAAGDKLKEGGETSVLVGVEKMDLPGLQDKTDIRGFEVGLSVAATSSGRAAPQDAPIQEETEQNEHAEQAEQSLTYDEGSAYTGQMLDGQRHGWGIWHCKTGQYDGQWSLDVQSGSGRQSWSDGRVYEGQFKNGMFDGDGKMTWHTQKGPLTYEGQYLEDLKHGRGKFIWADGRSYDGEWQKGRRHGRGEYVNSRSEKRIGFWVADQFQSWETPHQSLQAANNVKCNATNGKELAQASP